MKTPRLTLVGLTLASVLGLSAPAVASTPQVEGSASLAAAALAVPGSARHTAVQHMTHVRFLDFDHIIASGGTLHLRGQVVGRYKGAHGALAGVTVKIYRQYNASSPWVYLGSQTTDNGDYPRFDFATPALMNASYRVVFAGNDTFRGTQNSTWLTVYRLFHSLINDGPNTATLHGNVDPFYNHKVIWLQKRACASCAYVTVKRATTGMRGAYSFSVDAPPSGRWWWRVAIPGTGAFMASWSATYTTQLI